MTEETQPQAPAYKDDDFVYVDPEARVVVGLVEWSNAGKPKSMPMQKNAAVEEAEDGKKRRVSRQRYYPWGTYRSMKHMYKLEGKQPRHESSQTLDEALEKAKAEPFWD